MTWTPDVSFLIPARDRPEELKAALASCLAQSLDGWEAVVVDDHSETADLQALVAGFGDRRNLHPPREWRDRRELSSKQSHRLGAQLSSAHPRQRRSQQPSSGCPLPGTAGYLQTAADLHASTPLQCKPTRRPPQTGASTLLRSLAGDVQLHH